MKRRFFLRNMGLGAACSLAAHPLITSVTFAQAAGGAPLGKHRFISVILRGGMDGLDVLRPYGDPLWAQLRPRISAAPLGADLNGFYALNPALEGLLPLWQAGELGFVQATSTPYRDKRSHFDGQDLLEAGLGMEAGLGQEGQSGWLNRLLGLMPGAESETAYAFGLDAAPILAGPAPARHWAPNLRLALSPQAERLLTQLYHEDPLFRDTASEALALAALSENGDGAMGGGMGGGAGASYPAVTALADFAAGRLREQTRIAAFSLGGWDTHRGQRGALSGALGRLQHLILRLKAQMGPEVWGQTLLMAMTEFGRTARENGTGGTDHGTGGLMLLAGGALRGGRVYGAWPGLSEADLYDRRDLLPTSDLRLWVARGLRGLYGVESAALSQTVFPGLDFSAGEDLLR